MGRVGLDSLMMVDHARPFNDWGGGCQNLEFVKR